MPELPEVETVKETLKAKIVGEKIVSVDVYYESMIDESCRSEFKELLIGEEITNISRYGKYLFIIFNNISLISHLRMEGKYFIKEESEIRNVHEHIVFTFASGKTLRYHDTRKFGTMKLVKTTSFNEIMKEPELKKLGKEANDTTIDVVEFYNKIHKMRVKLKTALLDQTLIAGLGNIYVDEVCYLSGLHPEMPCNLLTLYDCKVILTKSNYVLEGAIKAGGTTIRSYTSSLGVTGRFQLKLHVHTKVGCPCEVCGNVIKKITVGGRGTYLCDKCQKINRPLIVGITGGIGSGKSSVSKYLKELLFPVIDTDIIAREVAENKKFLDAVKVVFGSDYVVDGKLDRKKMGNLIFNDSVANLKLTSMMHPIIKQKVVEEIKKAHSRVVFVDVPLLFESGFDDLCHYIICVYTNKDLNVERLIKRDNLTYDDAILRINSQLDIELKKQKSHFIIDNSFDLCYTYNQVNEVVNKILEMRK